jgi:hypothetical protein
VNDAERLELELRVSDPEVLITFACISDKNEEVSYINIRESGGSWWLTNLHTMPEFRNIDLGTKNMARFVMFWDRYIRQDIYLQVMPFTNRPVSFDKLYAFYGRFGFERTEVPGILKRSGQGT